MDFSSISPTSTACWMRKSSGTCVAPICTDQLHIGREYRHSGGELMGFFDRTDDKAPESRPDFSNVRSGGSSTAPAATQPTSTIGSSRTYIVVKGDSLSKIAKREY